MTVRRSLSARPPSSYWPAGVVLALLATALIALVSAPASGSSPSRAQLATSSVNQVGASQSGGAGVNSLSTDGGAVLSGNRATPSAHVASETDDNGGDPGPAVVPAQVNAAASTMATAAVTKPTRGTTSLSQSHHRDRAPPAAPLP